MRVEMFNSNLVLHARLTPREEDILTWIARGKTRAEIAVILTLSEEFRKDLHRKSAAQTQRRQHDTSRDRTRSLSVLSLPIKTRRGWINQPQLQGMHVQRAWLRGAQSRSGSLATRLERPR